MPPKPRKRKISKPLPKAKKQVRAQKPKVELTPEQKAKIAEKHEKFLAAREALQQMKAEGLGKPIKSSSPSDVSDEIIEAREKGRTFRDRCLGEMPHKGDVEAKRKYQEWLKKRGRNKK